VLRNVVGFEHGGYVPYQPIPALFAGGPEHEGQSFGTDAINSLFQYVEDFADQLVVIVAGYALEIRRFLVANPGLASRTIATHFGV
jgi:hypothetical protein